LVEQKLLNQGPEETRSLDDTLDRAWSALAALPPHELTMLSTEFLTAICPTPQANQ